MTLKRFIVLAFVAVLALSVVGLPQVNVQAQEDGDGPTEYHLRGTNPQMIGQYPDAFRYDGSDVRPLDWGFFEIHVDAENDVGIMFSRVHVNEHQLDADTLLEDSVITVIYPLFGTPTSTMPDYWQNGVAVRTDLHGDTGHEAPVLPTVYNELASWGPVIVLVDGEVYEADEEFMGQENVLNLMSGHTMFSEMVRNPETGEVFNADGTDFYKPTEPSNGSIFSDEVTLLHVVAHTDTRDQENFPPNTMFLHINFYDFEEIEPLEGIEYLTWEDMVDMTPERWEELLDGWLELIDQVEDDVRAEMDDAADAEEAEDSDS